LLSCCDFAAACAAKASTCSGVASGFSIRAKFKRNSLGIPAGSSMLLKSLLLLLLH
jgi:hypothetical protein